MATPGPPSPLSSGSGSVMIFSPTNLIGTPSPKSQRRLPLFNLTDGNAAATDGNSVSSSTSNPSVTMSAHLTKRSRNQASPQVTVYITKFKINTT